MENTDDVIVGVASGQDGGSSNSGHVTVNFRWDFWRPDPTAACNQNVWRTTTRRLPTDRHGRVKVVGCNY